mgnify:CR=1 FL=1
MKKLTLLLIGLFIVPALFFTSCDSGDDPGTSPVATPAFTLLKDYMVQSNLDVNNILVNTDGQKFVVAAPATLAEVDAFLDTYYIMDLRSQSAFDGARLDGANRVDFANILTTAATTTKPILVVCYSGQTACYATALLRMYGYSSTRALKWGMSGWNPNTAGSWNNNIGTHAKGHANWSSHIAPTNQTFADPSISTSLTNGEAILKKRVQDIVALGFGDATVSGTDVIANPGNYFINNYFSDTDYAGFGHIDGANRINPFTLADNSYLSLNSDASSLVTYCYTGQTSAVLTATLKVLGYNAKSLTFGMNGMYNDNAAWTSNKWSAAVSKDYPVISN